MRQAGGGERRIRFGREGILDLFGVKDPQRADLWRVQDALSVVGLGIEPSLPQADDDEPLQVWLASERLARDQPSAIAQAFATGSGRFEPADGRRLDRRSAQTLAALLPGVLLPVIGVAVLGPAFAVALLVLAIVLGAAVERGLEVGELRIRVRTLERRVWVQRRRARAATRRAAAAAAPPPFVAPVPPAG